ncbi:hypothetical protein BJ322DRAFT_1026544 [Thelephora terrestris]|uniref:Secreted protein n=1 Tax=Thelephora terrestris TaxID=56493 RepID=A0A9P6LB42_9AGAM|nr:hypothetical protein BJ322DRAFT_1026544 [Thelephora terrestris]
MIFPTILAVSVFSLLPFTYAATINARDNCAFVCPNQDPAGNNLLASSTGAILSCSYTGGPSKWCTYNAATGVFVGNGTCPKQAVLKCVEPQS